MTPLAIVLCVGCQFLIVVGQLFLKRAMSPGAENPHPHKARNFTVGILCLTLWFFLWVGLMSNTDLSKLFPFEGLNPALMAIAAAVLLKERMPPGAWLGLLLLCAGIVLVASS